MSAGSARCDEYGVPQTLRLSPPELADEVAASLTKAGTPARRKGHLVVVDDAADLEPEGRLELLFFLRSWALSHPEFRFELVDATKGR
jgi:hypothetical protein